MYMEASSPAQAGDRAILETDEDLSGCFCLHLSHHHNVRQYYYTGVMKYKHELKVMAGDKMVLRISEPLATWKDYFVQVDSNRLIKVCH